ncbi:toxin [Salmonella enterica subsp. enterica]|nr:toxin [Salmonella enterica subsp. enterica serovar Eastbourne]
MKSYQLTVIALSFFLTACGATGNEHLLREDPPATENSSLFSIRNVQSGYIINNVVDQFGREMNNWQLVPQVTPADVLAINPSGWVQFKDPKSFSCLIDQSGRSISKGTCDIKNKSSLFILIPSTTGAVQIKSFSSGKCLVDKLEGAGFIFGECVADASRPFLTVPEKNLWMLNPPVTASSVAPDGVQ